MLNQMQLYLYHHLSQKIFLIVVKLMFKQERNEGLDIWTRAVSFHQIRDQNEHEMTRNTLNDFIKNSQLYLSCEEKTFKNYLSKMVIF